METTNTIEKDNPKQSPKGSSSPIGNRRKILRGGGIKDKDKESKDFIESKELAVEEVHIDVLNLSLLHHEEGTATKVYVNIKYMDEVFTSGFAKEGGSNNKEFGWTISDGNTCTIHVKQKDTLSNVESSKSFLVEVFLNNNDGKEGDIVEKEIVCIGQIKIPFDSLSQDHKIVKWYNLELANIDETFVPLDDVKPSPGAIRLSIVHKSHKSIFNSDETEELTLVVPPTSSRGRAYSDFESRRDSVGSVLGEDNREVSEEYIGLIASHGAPSDLILPNRVAEYFVIVGASDESVLNEQGFYQPCVLDRYPRKDYEDFGLPMFESFCFPCGIEAFERWELRNFEFIHPFFIACLNYIEKDENIILPGIYRHASKSEDVDNFITSLTYDVGATDCVIEAGTDALLVASAVKVFLKNMITPVVPYDVYDCIMQLVALKDSDEKFNSMHEYIVTLKKEDRFLLGLLAHHISRVASHSEVNLMTVDNLAILLGPCILRPQNASVGKATTTTPSSTSYLSLPDRANILEFMIDHKEKLFAESETILRDALASDNKYKASPRSLPPPLKHNFVLAVAHEKTYGSCIVYYDPFNEAELPLHIPRAMADPRGARVWAPRCICFLSRFPFSDIFLSVLNEIYFTIKKSLKTAGNDSDEEYDTMRGIMSEEHIHIEPIVQLVTEELPIPIPGFLAIDFSVNEVQYTCAMSRIGDFPLSNSSVDSMFHIFPVRDWLKLFNAFILEQRIILVSEHLNLLTSVAEALTACMYPFKWQRIYIPVLPILLLDVLEAPMPFLVGLHSSIFANLNPSLLADVVIVKIDEGTVKFDIEKIPTLPVAEGNTLYHSICKIVKQPVASLDEFRPDDLTFCTDDMFVVEPQKILPSVQGADKVDHSNVLCMGSKERGIREAFLMFFINVLNGYHSSLFFLNSKMPVFNSDEHLRKHAVVGTETFLKIFFETMSFSQFLSSNDDKANTMFHNFYTAVLSNTTLPHKENADVPPTYFFAIPNEKIAVSPPTKDDISPVRKRSSRGNSISSSNELEMHTLAAKRLLHLKRTFPDLIKKMRKKYFRPTRKWLRDGVADYLHIPRPELQEKEWKPDMGENSKFLIPGKRVVLEAKENDIETSLQQIMSGVFIGSTLSEADQTRSKEIFSVPYGRELFLVILKQPQHYNVLGGTSHSNLCATGFENLAIITNLLLQLCACDEDFKTASNILDLSNLFFRDAKTKNGKDVKLYLSKRLENARIWQYTGFWEHLFIERLEDKLQRDSTALKPNEIGIDGVDDKGWTRKPSEGKLENSQIQEVVFGLTSSILMQMLTIGVPALKVKVFVTRIAQTQRLTMNQDTTLQMLVDNLSKAAEMMQVDEVIDGNESNKKTKQKLTPTIETEDEVIEYDLIDVLIRKRYAQNLISPSTRVSPNSSFRELFGKPSASIPGISLAVSHIGFHAGPVLCMDRTDDVMVTAGGDKNANVYDLGSMENTHVLSGHTDTVSTVIFDKESDTVVTGSHDRSVRVWKLSRKLQFWEKKGSKLGNKCTVLAGHTGSILCSARTQAFSLKTVITGSYDQTLRIWDVLNGKLLTTLEGHAQPVTCVKVATHQPIVLSGSRDNSLRLWSIDSGKCTTIFTGHESNVNEIHIDKERIASCSNDGTIKIWDSRTSTCVGTLVGHDGKVRVMQLGGVRDYTVVSGGSDGSVRIWDLRQISSGPRLVLLGHEKMITALKWDWMKIVSGSRDSTVRIWDANSGACIYSNKLYDDAISCIDFDETKFISTSWDGAIKVLHKEKNERPKTNPKPVIDSEAVLI